MTQKTISEELFEQFCREHGVPASRIPRQPDLSTADYRCQMSGQQIIAEVKQLDPNKEDGVALRRGLNGIPGMQWAGGDRVRAAIKEARPQLKQSAEGKFPGLLVLYNNVPVAPGYTDPFMVLHAMHGLVEKNWPSRHAG